jgi:hypothetical protein
MRRCETITFHGTKCVISSGVSGSNEWRKLPQYKNPFLNSMTYFDSSNKSVPSGNWSYYHEEEMLLHENLKCLTDVWCYVKDNYVTKGHFSGKEETILDMSLFSCCSHLEHRASVKRLVLLQFLNLKTVDRTPWTGDQPFARPLPTQDNTNTE